MNQDELDYLIQEKEILENTLKTYEKELDDIRMRLRNIKALIKDYTN